MKSKKTRSQKQKTLNTYSEFNNLMTKDQIDQKLDILQKFNTQKLQKNKTIQSIRTIKLENHCHLLDKLIKKSYKLQPLKLKYQQLCQEFGIDYIILKQIQNIEDKQNYIIKSSVQQILNNIDIIIEKYQIKQENINNQKNKIKDKLDLYDWLQIKSQYKSIKQRLKQQLVDLIQQKQNQKKISNFFTKHTKTVSLQTSQQISSTNFPDSTQNTSRLQQQQIEKKLILKIPNQIQQQQQINDIYLEWNQAIEQGYIQTNKNMHLLGYEYIKKNQSNSASLKKREEILDKCQQTGNYITEDELQYIASSSFLINKCIDKQFIERALMCLDETVKSQIELNIAEQILHNFYELKNLQIKQRNIYLNNLNKQKRQKIINNTKSYERHQHFSKDSLQMRVIKGKFISYLKDAQKKKFLKLVFDNKQKNELRKLQNQGNPLANIYVQKFKEIMMAIIRKYRQKKGTEQLKQQNFLERNTSKTQFKPIFTQEKDELQLNQVKHLFHPPSKVLTLDSEIPTKFQKEKIAAITKSFRLGIRNYDIKQSQFQQFYSGGPLSCRQYQSSKLKFLNEKQIEYDPKQEWIDEEIEIQAANKIKMALKKYLYRKKFNKVIEKKEQLKSVDIEQKIQKCMQAKKFFEELHKELKKQNKSNEQITDNNNNNNNNNNSPPKIPIQKIVKIQDSQSLSPQIFRINQQKTNEITLTTSRLTRQDTLSTKRIESNSQQRQKLTNQFSKSRMDVEIKVRNRKLLQAAKMKNYQIAEMAGFHYQQSDTLLYDINGNTPLYYSAKYGDETMTKFLLKLGADVNQICSNGNTPLHMAFLAGKQSIIIDFINRGGNLNILNNQNFTPLGYGTQELLKSLNLLHCIATVNKEDKTKSIENQQLFHRKIKSLNFEFDEELVSEIKIKV